MLDELGTDARALLPRDLDSLPGRIAARPFVEEEAALAEGRRQAHEPALRDGEHRADAAIQVVRNAGRLVDHQQAHAGKRPDRRFFAWQRHDPRLVLQFELSAALLRYLDRLLGRLVEVHDLAEKLGRLPQRRRQEQDEAAGREERRVQRQGGDRGRLARLPRAVQKHLPGAGEQELPLPEVRRDAPSAEDLRRVQC